MKASRRSKQPRGAVLRHRSPDTASAAVTVIPNRIVDAGVGTAVRKIEDKQDEEHDRQKRGEVEPLLPLCLNRLLGRHEAPCLAGGRSGGGNRSPSVWVVMRRVGTQRQSPVCGVWATNRAVPL